MTREEIAAIEAYCDDNKISRKNRLAELGISEWQFYSSKRHYAPSRDGVNVGGFLQLEPGGAFLPDPIRPARSRSARQKESERGTVPVSIELKTPNGTVMRISGELTGNELHEVIKAASSHV